MSPNLSTLRSLTAGDVILDLKPVLHIVYNDYKHKYCDNCLKNSSQLMKCSKCHLMSYCDKNCQKTDWKYHKNECKVLLKSRFKVGEEVMAFERSKLSVPQIERLLIRLWLTIKSDETFVSKKCKLIDGSELSLSDIEVRLREMSEDRFRMNQFDMICIDFKDYGIPFDRKELLHWFGLITSSSISQRIMSYSRYSGGHISQMQTPRIGLGLYPELYAVRHSCLPNSISVFNGLSLQLRANKPIAVGTQITRSYVYLGQNKAQRHRFLWEKNLIKSCDCIKCQTNDANVDYNRLNQLFEKQYQQMVGHPFPVNRTHLNEEMEVIRDIATKAMGEYDPNLTEILINQLINQQISGLGRKLRKTRANDQFYRRLEEHIRITYGVNHPMFIQTHKKGAQFFRLGTQ